MLLATPTAPLHELGAWLHQARSDLDAALNVVLPQPSPDEVPLDIAAVSAAAQSIEECTAVLSKALRFLHNLLDTADSKSSDGDDASFDAFKDQAMEFGTGKQPAESFYTYLETHMTDSMIAEFILDFARLLANVDQRTTLLAAHCRAVRRKAKDAAAAATAASSSKPPSPPPPLRRNLSMASSINDDTSPRDDDSFEYPSELHLDTVNHLMFVIHGIGCHGDFKEGDEEDVGASTAGSNRAFRELFRTMLDTHFK
ncbi:hypothetical protein B5M09_002783 [Aphanomyces astaci]|uniref:ZNF598/HEL2 PAH domain-containing protein n=1 Tax=Aphanomyces astaci TaxID=112090 RepID=A0A3R7WNC7_APHAT|nr:hypothetical protein B5M09_002783 [Aphanomyces astaci]